MKLSIEIQPKDSQTNARLLTLIQRIAPAAVYVPFNPGGHQNEIADHHFLDQVQNKLHIPVIPHLTGRYQSQSSVRKRIDELQQLHIDHLLALRGDNIAGQPPMKTFEHASDLIHFINHVAPEFSIAGACYPEGHYEAPSIASDIANLKYKVAAGAKALVTQVVFDNQTLYQFMTQLRAAGVKLPLSIGVMPVFDRDQVNRMLKLTKVQIPDCLAMLLAIEDDSLFAMAGRIFTKFQLRDLAQHGIERVHLYTLNNEQLLNDLATNNYVVQDG
ncbi:methylenetetrahydrofolate reductase [Nicoliella lavandulae]|uniref:Methylenetetrahydrofolate reductase n=1 Tax=Nicoliella lavandulae TaxID=3082954 RepID=A0ABU8SMB7_9LACO